MFILSYCRSGGKIIKTTEYLKKTKKDNRRYHFEKFKSNIKIFFSLNPNKKKLRKANHEIFSYDYWAQDSNALPSELYFRPKDIIVLDIFAKKDIPNVKKGLLKLFKKYYSHKFFGAVRFDNDIDRILNGLDQVLTSGKSWYRTSIFDFENTVELKKYVNYFEIEFLNISSSYAAIEFVFHLTDDFSKKIEEFNATNYENKLNKISRIWKKNNKKNGAVIGYATGGNDLNESAKSCIVYEQLEYVKKSCMKKMYELFPLFSSRDKKIYGVNVFETNIPCDTSLPSEVYGALGLDLFNGFLISKAEKLFLSTKTLTTKDHYETDMMYVYNDKLVTGYEGFSNPHNYIVENIKSFLSVMYLSLIYKNVGIYYYDKIVAYRNKINGIKINKKSNKKLLGLKYELENDFYDFNIIRNQIIIKDECDKMLKKMETNYYVKCSSYMHFNSYKSLVTKPHAIWDRIIENYEKLSNELDNKIQIATTLKDYNDVKKGYRISWYQFWVAVITLYLVVYPEKIGPISASITYIYDNLIKIIKVVLEFFK